MEYIVYDLEATCWTPDEGHLVVIRKCFFLIYTLKGIFGWLN